jgi:hypothetical protein
MLNCPAESVNHHLLRAGEFSTGVDTPECSDLDRRFDAYRLTIHPTPECVDRKYLTPEVLAPFLATRNSTDSVPAEPELISLLETGEFCDVPVR